MRVQHYEFDELDELPQREHIRSTRLKRQPDDHEDRGRRQTLRRLQQDTTQRPTPSTTEARES